MFLYLDPGSGSMLIQAVIAGSLAFVMFFKQVKYKILSFFGSKQIVNKNEEKY